MQPYNLEIFGRDYTLKQHFTVDDIDYKLDYLSAVENSVYLPFVSTIKKGDYLRLNNGINEFFGYISSLVIDEVNEGWCTVGFKPFIELFNSDIIFNISTQGSGYLEDALGGYITSNWISGSDSSQNIEGLQVESISQTSGWTFYVANKDGLTNEVVNFMDLIREALTKYHVGLYVVLNLTNNKIKVQIGKKIESEYYIEADLPNVIERSIIVNRTKNDTNKLIIFNSDNLTQSTTYYLHPNGSYNTTNSNRITPVIYQIVTVKPTNGKTFAQLAQDEADKLFGNNLEKNLIELTVINEDDLVKAPTLEIGRAVKIISNGITYDSILTGYERAKTTKLIFGTVRIDLTKILKEALK